MIRVQREEEIKTLNFAFVVPFIKGVSEKQHNYLGNEDIHVIFKKGQTPLNHFQGKIQKE